jgi:hypothetical protein
VETVPVKFVSVAMDVEAGTRRIVAVDSYGRLWYTRLVYDARDITKADWQEINRPEVPYARLPIQ